ncbi:MAG: Kdo hydroxylase family protein [Isosphaeraceae bacterium]
MARITVELGDLATDEHARRLETGDILYFPKSPFELSDDDKAFLLRQKQAAPSLHKNISYRPARDRLKGADSNDRARMREIMKGYSDRAISFMASFFPGYAKDWKIDFASFRPIEEQGRETSLRSRNDLLHVDSFPSRPSQGDRLLRFFTNVNPERPRVWITSDTFEALANRFAAEVGIPERPDAKSKFRSQALRVLSSIGLPVVDRPPYDRFMLRFHHFLKENAAFQRDCPKDRWEFPPGSSWIVFTDTASHACLSGQFALEQTFIVHRRGLVWP